MVLLYTIQSQNMQLCTCNDVITLHTLCHCYQTEWRGYEQWPLLSKGSNESAFLWALKKPSEAKLWREWMLLVFANRRLAATSPSLHLVRGLLNFPSLLSFWFLIFYYIFYCSCCHYKILLSKIDRVNKVVTARHVPLFFDHGSLIVSLERKFPQPKL